MPAVTAVCEGRYVAVSQAVERNPLLPGTGESAISGLGHQQRELRIPLQSAEREVGWLILVEG